MIDALLSERSRDRLFGLLFNVFGRCGWDLMLCQEESRTFQILFILGIFYHFLDAIKGVDQR